jgi:single-strand DNA-binding protein
MGKSVNTVTLLGHVGQNPDTHASGEGVIVNFSLATSERTKGSDGNWTDRPEWHNIVAFGRTAEIVRDYVHRGSKVYVEGRLQTRNWEDKASGKKVYKTETVVREIILLDNKPSEENSQPAYASKSRFPPKAQDTESDPDIPF